MADAVLGLSMAALLVWVSATDLRRRLVPDAAVGAAAALVLVTAALADTPSLPERLASGLGAGGFLLVAAVLRPGGMGLGDVKLAAVLGLYLGRAVMPALLMALIAGALVGLASAGLRGVSPRSVTIPFAPFLASGAAVAWLAADNVAPWS